MGILASHPHQSQLHLPGCQSGQSEREAQGTGGHIPEGRLGFAECSCVLEGEADARPEGPWGTTCP